MRLQIWFDLCAKVILNTFVSVAQYYLITIFSWSFTILEVQCNKGTYKREL